MSETRTNNPDMRVIDPNEQGIRDTLKIHPDWTDNEVLNLLNRRNEALNDPNNTEEGKAAAVAEIHWRLCGGPDCTRPNGEQTPPITAKEVAKAGAKLAVGGVGAGTQWGLKKAALVWDDMFHAMEKAGDATLKPFVGKLKGAVTVLGYLAAGPFAAIGAFFGAGKALEPAEKSLRERAEEQAKKDQAKLESDKRDAERLKKEDARIEKLRQEGRISNDTAIGLTVGRSGDSGSLDAPSTPDVSTTPDSAPPTST